MTLSNPYGSGWYGGGSPTPAPAPAPKPGSFPSTYSGSTLSGPTGISATTGPVSLPAPSGIVSSPSTGSTDPANGVPGLTGADRNAYEATKAILESYGLGDMAPLLLNYAQQGFDSQTTYYLVQQTSEWKQRFAGNEMLKKQGLAPLDPNQYLAVENAFSQVLQSAGVPAGMYGRSDFANWIGGNVSPSEVQSRVQLAADNVANADPYFKSALQAMGVDTGHQIAYFLDQSRAMPFLQRQEQASQIGAAALRNHLNLDPNTALALASIGVSQGQAEQGYGDIAKMLPRLHDLASITPGASFDQKTAEQDVLFNNADAAKQAATIQNTEQARFAGSGGMSNSVYHPGAGLQVPLEGAF